MALYQNGILISGANKLPQMTYAEWQALPAAERPSEWICTDRSYSDLPASDVAYDNTDSGLSADNIQDAIDEVAQSGGGGGHTIVNPSGQSMSQENKLQFTDADVADDSTNGKTKVSIVREMTKAQYDALSETERKGIIRITDEPDIVMGDVEDDKVEVEQVAGGTKSYKTLLNELYALIDFNKVSKNTILTLNGLIYNPIIVQNDGCYFSRTGIESNLPATFEIGVLESNSYYNFYQNNQYTNKSNDSVPVGTKITFYYGTQSAPIELTTDAEHCLLSNGNNLEQVYSETVTTGSGTSISIEIYKYGKLVYMVFGNGNYTASANDTLATIPEGFRPIAYVDFRDTFSDKRIRIKPDGTVFCSEALSNEIIRGSLCYITN